MRKVIQLLVRINLQPEVVPFRILKGLIPFAISDILKRQNVIIAVVDRLIQIIT
ncbi:hypothetical protein D3C75_843070 [compost metagenome]